MRPPPTPGMYGANCLGFTGKVRFQTNKFNNEELARFKLPSFIFLLKISEASKIVRIAIIQMQLFKKNFKCDRLNAIVRKKF